MTKNRAVLDGLIDSKKSVRRYRDKINEKLSLVKKSMVDIGGLLNEAEINLSKKEYRELEADIDLGKRSIQKLKRIAADARIEKYRDRLPESWGTLYEISKLDDEVLEEGIKKGKINIDTQRKEIINYQKPGKSHVKGKLLVEIREKTGANEFQIEELMKLLSHVDEKIFEVNNRIEVEYHKQQEAEIKDAINAELKEARALIKKLIARGRKKYGTGSARQKYESTIGSTEERNSMGVNDLIKLLGGDVEYEYLAGINLRGKRV